MDVVPADEDPDTTKWTHPPFAGEIEDGYIYGRGALDLKNNVTLHRFSMVSLTSLC